MCVSNTKCHSPLLPSNLLLQDDTTIRPGTWANTWLLPQPPLHGWSCCVGWPCSTSFHLRLTEHTNPGCTGWAVGSGLAHADFLFQGWVLSKYIWKMGNVWYQQILWRHSRKKWPLGLLETEEMQLCASCIPRLLIQFALWSGDLASGPSKRCFLLVLWSFHALCHLWAFVLVSSDWVFSHIYKLLIWPIPTHSSGFG